jgi:hypothetical protein
MARIRPIKPEDMMDVAKTMIDEVNGVINSDGFMNGADQFVQKKKLNYSSQIQQQ